MYAIAQYIPLEIRRQVAARAYHPKAPNTDRPAPVCAQGRCALSVAINLGDPDLLRDQLDDYGQPESETIASCLAALRWITDSQYDNAALAAEDFIHDFDRGRIFDLAAALGVTE